MTLADDVDTRAITRRLREDGSLNGVLSTEQTKTNDELLEISRTWNIVGEDLTGQCSISSKKFSFSKDGTFTYLQVLI